MSWRSQLVLALLGLAVSIGVARLQSFPGYLDSDYYFAGGIQLAQGRGFTEPYLWNYLDDPASLPHPSHTYWMPMASLLTAAGMKLLGVDSYGAGRLAFLLIAGLVPLVTARLAYSFTRRGELALTSGLLAVFSIFHAPFLPVPDNFGPFMLLGGLYLLACSGERPIHYGILGLLSGFMMLARTDGVLWLGLSLVLISWRFLPTRNARAGSIAGLAVLAGFFLVMGPWFWRNFLLFGAPLAPGGQRLLWLKSYDETFLYPAGQLTMASWLAQGWSVLLHVRWQALLLNLENAFAAQGGILLFPFILLGAWQQRAEARVRIGGLAWLALLAVMTLIFPFAGKRGGFFHAGAALQTLWWSLAPLGLESVVAAARRRNWFTPAAFTVFRTALVAISMMLTGVMVYVRIIRPGWGEGEHRYPEMEAFLQEHGARAGEVVIVRNPPGYYLMTGRPALVIPYGDEGVVLDLAAHFHARFVIVERAGAVGPIEMIYNNLSSRALHYLGEIDDARIFEVEP